MKKDDDIIEIIVDEAQDDSDFIVSEEYDIETNNTTVKEKITSFFNQFDLPPAFIGLSASICALVVIASLILGITIPKSDKAVAKRLVSLHKSDKAYSEINAKHNTAKLEKDNTDSRLTSKQQELDEFNKSQDNLQKIQESNTSMQSEKETLQSEVTKKQNSLANLESSITSHTKRTLTWSSGRYTVGKDIASGKYNVMGSGSISIGNSGKSLVNKNLTSEGESFTLNTDDIIQINGNAKFIPA